MHSLAAGLCQSAWPLYIRHASTDSQKKGHLFVSVKGNHGDYTPLDSSLCTGENATDTEVQNNKIPNADKC